MSSKYDIESFVNGLLDIIQTNLPAKIAAINAEKADSITIEAVPNEKYFNSMGEQVLNSSPFIYYVIINLETNPVGPKTAVEITVNIEVVFDNTNKTDTLNKVLRYSRSLREVVQENFKSGKFSNLKVSELVPGDAQLNAGSDFKVGGITVQSTIAG